MISFREKILPNYTMRIKVTGDNQIPYSACTMKSMLQGFKSKVNAFIGPESTCISGFVSFFCFSFEFEIKINIIN